jgi:hypothetical protein
MQSILSIRRISRVLVAAAFLALTIPGQAQSATVPAGSVRVTLSCEVLMHAVVSGGGQGTVCNPHRDGATLIVPAGSTVGFVATAPVATWFGCTPGTPGPPTWNCTAKVDGPLTVGNTAPPAKAATPTPSPAPATGGGGGRFR